MRRPRRYITRMMLFLTAVAIACVPLFPAISGAFMANPALNGLILGVLAVGIAYTMRQVVMLEGEVRWLANYRGGAEGGETGDPHLLAPMAAMLRERRGRMSLSAMSMRSILDSISARLDESREISRYLIGLLIFLGLLGTFWGLLNTIGAVSGTIGNLTVASQDFASMFDELKAGLQAPLSGMGTAFSSSLFGLAGSVVLGFIDLQAGQAQNRFYNDLEEWLSSVTTLSGGGAALVESEGGGAAPAYVTALLEQTVESINDLQRVFERAEQNRTAANATLVQLAERVSALTDHLRAEQTVLKDLAEQGRSGAMDDAGREHLANIDVQVGRLIEELQGSRDQLSKDLRGEIKLLARTISAASRDGGGNR